MQRAPAYDSVMKSFDGPSDPTLVQGAPHREPELSDTVAADGSETGSERGPSSFSGYKLGELLGRGGMGEVLLAADLRIGRDVAIKRMRRELPSEDAITRFLREAKIQARLDHPAIVPVHELGRDPAGLPYFTMKRLTGVTLQRVLERPEGLQKLLRAFVDVCLAIEFAHARGVIHRDLKPANIMLGDYGEVYVLDWGLARVLGDHESVAATAIESLDGDTQVGMVLGTPGYMSPEQAHGQPVEPAADIYALGAILFEILAGAPLHPRGEAALVTTIAGGPVSPARRCPERTIAPELDAVCVLALSDRAEDRPRARELADQVQRYLDGDRDVGQRRALAAGQLELARAAVASGEPARRGEAMAAAGRALALDPESSAAATLVTRLMLEPPRELPPSLARRLEDLDRGLVIHQGRVAAYSIAAYLTLIPLMMWIGVRDWSIFLAIFAVATLTALGAVAMAAGRVQGIAWAVFANAVVIFLLSRMFGSFVLVPGLASSAAISLIAFPTLISRPWLVIAPTVVAFLLPLVLEAVGIFQRTWQIIDGALVTRSPALALDGTPAALGLIAANTVMIVVAAMFVRSHATTQRRAQRQLEIQAWHLGQLLPVEPPRPDHGATSR
jgi:eukaryotic-like serine/threonine-protein kinase